MWKKLAVCSETNDWASGLIVTLVGSWYFILGFKGHQSLIFTLISFYSAWLEASELILALFDPLTWTSFAPRPNHPHLWSRRRKCVWSVCERLHVCFACMSGVYMSQSNLLVYFNDFIVMDFQCSMSGMPALANLSVRLNCHAPPGCHIRWSSALWSTLIPSLNWKNRAHTWQLQACSSFHLTSRTHSGERSTFCGLTLLTLVVGWGPQLHLFNVCGDQWSKPG